jgi:O-antigen ligase
MAQRSVFSGICLWLLVVTCLTELNGLGVQALGIQRMFSYMILALCLIILLINRFTVVRDLGKSGWYFMAFLGSYVLIGMPMNIQFDAAGLLDRWHEIEILLSAALIVLACAVGVSHLVLAFRLKWPFRWLGIAALLMPATIFLSKFFPGFIAQMAPLADIGRMTGFYLNPNEAGSALCCAAAILFACLAYDKRRWWCVIGLVACSAAVIWTFSRAAVITLGLLAILQAFIGGRRGRVVVLMMAGVLVAGIVWYVIRAAQGGQGLDPTQQTRINMLARIFGGELSDETTGSRFSLAMNGITHWLESPLIGHGLGGQRYVGESLGSHNTFIRVLGETGILPFGLLMLFFVMTVQEGMRCKVAPIRILVLGFMLVFFLGCMTNHGELVRRHHNVLLGLSFGLLAAAHEMEQVLAQQARRRVPYPVR